MLILTESPANVNHYIVRQQRMESALAGYHCQPIPNNQIGSYLNGLAVRAQKFILGKPGDRFCRISLIVSAIYVLILLVQAVRFYMGVAR
jgi:hypothetical protein